MSDETPTPEFPASGVEDFDAFWDAESAKDKPRTTKIMGRTVTLPRQLPLQFDMEARRLQRSQNPEDIRALAAILVGADTVEAWAKAGMDLEQFMVLLAWLPRVIAGDSVTLAEVRADVRKSLEQKQAGVDPTRPQNKPKRKSSGSSSKHAGR